MVRRGVIGILALVMVALCTVVINSTRAASTGSQKKVLLISIDGLRPEFYLSNTFETPALKALKNAGAWATSSMPVFPSVTYPNHTSLITGVYAGKHGVLSNSLFSWEKGPQDAWYWEASHIKVPTIHSLAKKQGQKTASLRWPVTMFADVTYLVPEIFGMKGYYEGDGFELTVKYTEKSLMDDILKVTTLKKYSSESEMDFWVAEATAHVIKSRQPDLTTVHLANVDHVEHSFGRDAAETKAAVKDVDKNIKIILDSVDLKTTCVIVTGDHGFVDVSQKISPNTLFIKAGWIETDKAGKITSWKVIAQSSGAQAAIYTKDNSLVPAIHKLLKENESVGYTVLEKDRLDQLGAYPEAVLAISGRPGFTVSGSTTAPLVSSSGSMKGQHGFVPDFPEIQTGLIASGCGIPSGKNLGAVHVIDVAPTIADILGLAGATFDGQVLPLFK